MLNRAVLIIKYKQPAVDWINQVDPYDSSKMTLKSANEESSVYLIDQDAADSPESLRSWIELNLEALFIDELNGWYTEESLWPTDLNVELFNRWFTIECHTVITDTVGTPIVDDGI
ncbi:hypothetical protein EKG38_19135 [Shewanella canadensis]|uniref:Uncharacterized protein n=1 Tax=Shewanella canadensis TaxID=271096 RepID=A0A3S0KT96_9GAMM|nr:hypothetical protein [Shewanella canadensis]RTR37319.1 hypothetical protein EKG38_19135 [Shewanella canadensis]